MFARFQNLPIIAKIAVPATKLVRLTEDYMRPELPGLEIRATVLGHVVRGGNWEIGINEMKSFSRFHFDTAKYWIGFRCARTAT